MNLKKILKKLLIILLTILFVLGGFYYWTKISIKEHYEKKEALTLSFSEEDPEEKILEPTYEEYLTEAKQLIEYEDYALASNKIVSAIRKNPDDIDGFLILGEIYLRIADIWKLENLITKLEERFPEDPATLTLRIRQMILKKDFTQVLQILEKKDTLSPDLSFYQAMILALQNDHKKTKEILERIAFDQDLGRELKRKILGLKTLYEKFETLSEWKNAHLFAEIAKSLADNNENFLAREFANIATIEAIDYTDAWIIRGYTNLALQLYAESEADFRQAYALDPIRPEIQYFLGTTLYHQKKYIEAVLFLEKVTDSDFEFTKEARWQLLDIFTKQKKYDRVIELYRELLTYDSDEKKITSAIYTALDLIKKPEIALEFGKMIVEKDPESLFALNSYAWALIGNKKYTEAKQILEKAEKLDETYLRTQLNKGFLYEQQKFFDKAKNQYKTTYERGRSNPDDSSIVNLAVQRFNNLLDMENPKIKNASPYPKNSP